MVSYLAIRRIKIELSDYTVTISEANSETLRAVMFQVQFFWVVTPCGVVVGF
jgi:hypothetical protein